MAGSLQRLGINQLNHKLKVKRGGIEVTNGNISGSLTSTGSFGKLEVAGNTTLTGDITIGGNMTLGDADTDSINITADLTSNLIPNADSTYDIGSSSKNWRYGYVEQLSATHVTASNNITATAFSGSTMELGSNLTSKGTISGSSVYGTTIGQNRTDGLKTITIESNSTINQDVTTDATPTFGGATLTGDIKTSGVISGSSDIIVGNIGGSHISGSTGNLKVTDSLLASKVSGSEFTGSSAIFDTATITTATIVGGTVTGITDITVADGGTGVSTLTDGGVLLGSGTGAITATSVLGDGEILIGDGSGDPVALDIGSSTAITTLGTIATGTWEATDVAVAHGGTGASTFTDGGILLGSGTGAVTATAVLADGEILIGDGTTDPVPLDIGSSTAITTLGTIATGTWEATDVAVAHGGTGVSTLTDGGVLLGSGTSAVTAMAVLGDGEFIVGDGSTDPVAESGATLRTSIGVGTGDSPQFTGVTATGTITGSSVYGTTIGQNRTDGIKTITIESDSIVNQDLTTDATPTFAGVTTSGDIVSQGDVIAENYIVSSSITYMTQSFSSGSTIFGDDISDNHRFTGSVNISGSINAISPETGSTTVLATNVQNGYPTSNFWGENLEGSYFNNFDNTTHVSEILRFMSGVLSASLDVADASPNTKTWASLTTTENSLGTADSCDGYLPQSYDDSNATLKYLVTKNWVGTGTKIFSGITVYHDNGPTYKIDFDSVVDDATKETVSSSADAQLFGLGGLTSGAATQFDVRVVVTQSFSDTGSIATPTTSSNTFTTQSQLDVSMTSFGTTNGVELAKINTTQPAVIPAAYQDGKFADLGGTVMSGSLTRRYSGSAATFNDFTSVSASGYYSMHDLKVGIATGSGNFSYKSGATKTKFYAPVDQIESDIGSNTRGITNATQSYLSATSRSLSGVPYLIGATYHLSASVHGLFDPLYKDSSTIADDTIGSVGIGSVSATSGVDGLSTSGGTIQTANAVFSDSGSSPTVRSTGTVPYRTDIYKHNTIYTLSGTTGENINQTGFGDTTFTVGVRGRNRANSRSTQATYTFFYHSGSTFAQPADSGSLGIYQRAQGYDGGSLAGTSEAFTGEDFRIVLDNNVIGFNGTAWTTTYEINQLGSYDLQVKPGYLVDPGGDYRYWYYEDYNDHGTYKYYIRRFQTSGTKTSMTVDVGKTLVNWNSTSNGSAVGLIFKSAASGSGGNTEQSVCRLYDPSDLTSNLIESSISNDNHKNPFTTAINLYGNTGGSKSTTQYTVPMRNSDGMYLDATDNELYVLVRYKGDEAPVTAITMTFS